MVILRIVVVMGKFKKYSVSEELSAHRELPGDLRLVVALLRSEGNVERAVHRPVNRECVYCRRKWQSREKKRLLIVR